MRCRCPSRRVVVWGVWAAVFLLVGAVVNVVVAWGLVLLTSGQLELSGSRGLDEPPLDLPTARSTWDRLPIIDRFDSDVELTMTEFAEIRGPVAEQFVFAWLSDSTTRRVFGENLNSHILRSPFDDLGDLLTYREVAAGWPASSLAGSSWQVSNMTVPDRQDLVGQTFRVDCIPVKPLQRRRANQALPRASILPFGPTWPGFLINTVFYGAIAWLLLFAPRAVRRRVRIMRNQCPACGYPVGVSAVCTECGEPVKGVVG